MLRSRNCWEIQIEKATVATWAELFFILAAPRDANHPHLRCSHKLKFCLMFSLPDETRDLSGAATALFFFSTSNCHIAWALSCSQSTAKITILAHSKEQGWLIKRRWWSGKYQSNNISEVGVSGCTVYSVTVCFQWLPCRCVSLKAQFVHKCSYNVCVPMYVCVRVSARVCVCVWRVSVFLLHPVARCVWVCVGSLWGCWLLMLVGGLWSVFSGLHDLACENPLTPKTNTRKHTRAEQTHGNTHRNGVEPE